MNVNLRQLRAFVTIGRLASFTRAAEALNASQPTLSAQIRDLEETLDVRLFDRSTRSVVLTGAGEDLLPVVDQVLADLDSVVQRAKDVARGAAGRLTIAALPSVASQALPRAVAAFRRQHPNVVVHMRDALAGRVLELIRSREVDFGISSAVDIDAQLEFLPLTHDRIVAVMPLRHPLARHRSLNLEALLAHPLILMHRESSVRQIVDAAFATTGRIATPSYEAVYMASAMGMVRAGLGVALLPSSAYEVVEARGVTVRALDAESLVRPVGVVKLRTRSLSPAAQAFLAVFAQHAVAPAHERRRRRRDVRAAVAGR